MKYLSLLSALLLLAACSAKTEGTSTQTDSTNVETAGGPIAIPCRSYSETQGEYTIAIRCDIDSQCVVRDCLDTEFYDNIVTVSVSRGGQELFSQVLTKDDFKGEFDGSRCILQGVAFNELKDGAIVLGAQVGEPANDEGGANFRIVFNTSGTYSIAADNNFENNKNVSN